MRGRASRDAERFAFLENLYGTYNKPEFIDPDPLALVIAFRRPEDAEIAGLVCAALALGNVKTILASCSRALDPLGPRPSESLRRLGFRELSRMFSGFRHRFFDGSDISSLYAAMGKTLLEHDAALGKATKGRLPLEDLYLAGRPPGGGDCAAAGSAFVRALASRAPLPWRPNLIPDPGRGSASKRLLLFLRWMIRKDEVDPGTWGGGDPASLLVPLDTHMAAACRRLGLLTRGSPDLKASRETTDAFRCMAPGDPVRYDFCITRAGIREELSTDVVFRGWDACPP